MKKSFIIIGIILIICIVGIFGFKCINNFKNEKVQNKTINSFVESAAANGETYMLLEINPKLMLILDENNNVKDISQLNDDARIFKSEEFYNLSLEDAITKVIKVAKENSYLTDNKNISISTLTEDNGCIEQVKKYIIENDNDIKVSEINKSKEELFNEIVAINGEKRKKAEETAQKHQQKVDYINQLLDQQQREWDEKVDRCLPKILSMGCRYVIEEQPSPCCDENITTECYHCSDKAQDSTYSCPHTIKEDDGSITSGETYRSLYGWVNEYCE